MNPRSSMSGPERGMGWRGTAAKDVELSKRGPDVAAVGSGSG